MAKITLSSVGNILTAGPTINNNSALIEAAIENTLSRDGTSPNEMNAPLDMNNNRVFNLPVPVAATEAARKADVDALTADANAAVEAAEDARDASQAYSVASGNSASNAAASALAANDSALDAAASAAEAATFDPDNFYTKVAADARYQPIDSTLTALAGVSTAADQLVYATGPDAFAVTGLTSFARSVLDDANASAARATLGAGDVVGPSSAVDNAVARYDLTTGKLIQGSSLLVADTTGDLSRSGGGGIDIQGTNTNDDAPAGYIGEIISSTVASGSAIALTTSTLANVTSIALTAGDWDVFGQIAFAATATGVTSLIGAVSLTSATLPSAEVMNGSRTSYDVASVSFGSVNSLPLSPCRISVASGATVYLVARLVFSGGTGSAFGKIWARRVR